MSQGSASSPIRSQLVRQPRGDPGVLGCGAVARFRGQHRPHRRLGPQVRAAPVSVSDFVGSPPPLSSCVSLIRTLSWGLRPRGRRRTSSLPNPSLTSWRLQTPFVPIRPLRGVWARGHGRTVAGGTAQTPPPARTTPHAVREPLGGPGPGGGWSASPALPRLPVGFAATLRLCDSRPRVCEDGQSPGARAPRLTGRPDLQQSVPTPSNPVFFRPGSGCRVPRGWEHVGRQLSEQS